MAAQTNGKPGAFAGIGVAVVGYFNPKQSGIRFQAEVLADAFETDGAAVLRLTYQRNRWLRPFSVIWELLASSSPWSVACVQAFSDWSFVNAAAAIFVARMMGKRVAVVYRGGAGPRFLAQWPRMVPFVLRRAQVLVVPSSFLAQAFDGFGLHPYVIPNVIDLSEFVFKPRSMFSPNLVWVRHLRPGYNPWMAMEVLLAIQRSHPDATLTMVGDGTMADELRDRVRKQGIQGVRFTGRLPQADLRRVLEETDVFLNTTNVDNQPRSVLEAMACGLPVVSTNVGGIPHMLEHARTALLVEPRDVRGMSEAVERILREPSLGRRLAEEGLRHVQNHAWKAVLPAWRQALTGNNT